MNKECKECGIDKPLSDYYKHKQMGDGHLNICKVCKKAYANNHRKENIETVRAYDRERALLPHRKALATSNTKKARARNPLYNKAHLMVDKAVKKGTLVKPDRCECCGDNVKLEAHHEDYEYPLRVVWLCVICHRKNHNGKCEESDNIRFKVKELYCEKSK